MYTRKEFQSTLPHGERLGRISDARIYNSFNPRSRMGSDILALMDWIGPVVSIHAPAWGATRLRVRSSNDSLFQSTLPHGERRKKATMAIITPMFQSTLPHGERHDQVDAAGGAFRVSIHAPAWGATYRPGIYPPGRLVSIHAPAWGAT